MLKPSRIKLRYLICSDRVKLKSCVWLCGADASSTGASKTCVVKRYQKSSVNKVLMLQQRLIRYRILILHRRAFYSTKEFAKYELRKSVVAQSPAQYYPPLGSTRSVYPVLRVKDFISQFEHHNFSVYPRNSHPDTVQLEGRLKSVRKAGRAMYFMDLVQDDCEVQICASNQLLGDMDKEAFSELHSFIRKGDHVTCIGHPSTTNVGELTLKLCKPIRMCSPCLKLATLPPKVTDRLLINGDRVMNYLVTPRSKAKIMIKSLVTQAIRKFLIARDFLEVNTPLLGGAGTGANAEPFHTNLKALADEKLQLRVAPELWLKKLVIGGFDKVFEIGPNFRNEGIDSTHNPEFMTCEFYRSFTSLPELMKLTEDLIRSIYNELEARQDAVPLLRETLPPLKPLLTELYHKYEFIPTIEQLTGASFPEELSTESLLAYHKQIGVLPPSMLSPSALLDNLSGKILETISSRKANTPIFIYNQPALMSPLAKSAVLNYNGREYEISMRFELFINGKEYVNSYEEENSPFSQSSKFRLQQQAKEDYNDKELLIPDWNYVKLMEYGLPPTGGWGCGIDRLSMLFSGSERIEDVLTFGVLKDVIKQ